jgi:hypothetical protein
VPPYEVVEGVGEPGGAVLVPDFEDELSGRDTDAFELVLDEEESDDPDEDVELRFEDD